MSTLVHLSSNQRQAPQMRCVFFLLTPREQTVIALRFGIGDGNSNSLSEIDKKLGVTRERVRQLEGGA